MQSLDGKRKKRFKWAYTTRNVDRDLVVGLLTGDLRPSAGDLVLARVDMLGQHRKLELTTSRRAGMFEGDEIVVVFGDRYAPDQFEAIVPDSLKPCHLVAAGGVASRLLNRHERMKRATRITPLGLLGDAAGNPVNLRSFRLEHGGRVAPEPVLIVVAGTAMNSGKTTACASVVKGMVRRGFRVGAAKLTGTGAGADYRALVDAGAEPVFDFVDAGYVSTYRVEADALLDIAMTLIGTLAGKDVDVVVMEVADGLLQRETSRLFVTRKFTELVDGVIFAANDALGAMAGVAWLTARQLPVIAVTGVLTSSALATREAEISCGLPVFPTASLARGAVAGLIHDCLASRRGQKRLRQAGAVAAA